MFSLRDLECFLAVVEHKTFSKAAQSLNMAQPPLSRRIADLERELGMPLFIRGLRQVRLTQAGFALVREARVVLEQAKLAERIVRDTVIGNVGYVRLGYIGATGLLDIIPRAIRLFRNSNPHASIKPAWVRLAHQSDALRFGAIDIALISGVVDSTGFRSDRLATNRLVAVLPAKHALARGDVVHVSDLASEPIVELPRYGPTGLHDLIRGVFAREGFVPDVVQEAEGYDMLIGCVAAGIGIALVNGAARRLPIPDVIYREIVPKSPPVHLTALSRMEEDNPLVGAFIEQLKVVYSERATCDSDTVSV